MTAKFEAFKAALETLCEEHRVTLRADMNYDVPYLAVLDDESGQIGCYHLTDETETEEQRAARVSREAHRAAEWEAGERARNEASQLREAERMRVLEQDPKYQALREHATTAAQENRKNDMRVSTDPQDAAYDPQPRRVWINDVEVTGWTVADEFRRVVIVDGKARFGSVRIERLESGEGGNPLQATPTAPIDTGFVGVMEHTPDPKPEAPAPAEAPAPVVAAPAVPSFGYGKKRR